MKLIVQDKGKEELHTVMLLTDAVVIYSFVGDIPNASIFD